jgi:xeroderma pigmentosum group C-complementing protein
LYTPTAVEAFRKHHLYCLERHLGRFECVHPRKAVGVFNGEPVFLRASVQRLQSAFKWRRLGREVTASERSTPARWYNPNNRSRDGGGGDGDDESLDADDERASRGGWTGSLALFGLWQTTEIVPPEVVDGVLPKNNYGNIEVWSPAHVPRGAVHLRLPRIEQVAKQLGVDYAQAVVGFERQGPMGRATPQVDGIVVVKAVETVLVDAHADMQQATIERAIEKNQRIAARRWGRLTKRLLLRQRLEDDYGKV